MPVRFGFVSFRSLTDRIAGSLKILITRCRINTRKWHHIFMKNSDMISCEYNFQVISPFHLIGDLN